MQYPSNELMNNYMLVKVLPGLSIKAKLNQTKLAGELTIRLK